MATNVFRFSLVKKAAFHFPPLCHHVIIITSSLGYLYIEEGKGVKWEWKDTKGNHSIIPLPRTFHFWKSLDSQKDSIDSLYLSFSRAISLYWHLFFLYIYIYISPAVIDFCRMVMSMNLRLNGGSVEGYLNVVPIKLIYFVFFISY